MTIAICAPVAFFETRRVQVDSVSRFGVDDVRKIAYVPLRFKRCEIEASADERKASATSRCRPRNLMNQKEAIAQPQY